jgi:RecB family exonuclease
LEITKQRGLLYIRWYYEKYLPFDRVICDGTEVTLWFEIQPGTKFQAKMDRFDVRDDTAYIVDYKTTKSLPKDGEDTIKQQLSLYALAVQQNYGDKIKTIYGSVIYLHLEKEYTREITQDILEQIKQQYLKVIEMIEHDKFVYNFGNSEAFTPLEGKHCSQCPFQRICPIWKHLFDHDDEVDVGDLGTKTIRQMIDTVYEL